MRKLAFLVLAIALLLAFPVTAYAHHVGLAEESMPADQWLFVDSVAHGASADGMDMDIAPGVDMATESMVGDTYWMVSGDANMNTP